MQRAAPHSLETFKRLIRDRATGDHRRDEVGRRIERTALELFSTRGVESVTVSDIARAAAVSRRTFYRYFPSKTDILSEAPRRSLEAWAREARALPASEALTSSFWQAEKNASHDRDYADEHRLSIEVRQKSPAAWERATGPVLDQAATIYERLIAERLKARGQDVCLSGAIAAALTAFIARLEHDAAEAGARLDIDMVDKGLFSMIAVLSEGVGAVDPAEA